VKRLNLVLMVLFLAGCSKAPSEDAIETAVVNTQAAQPTEIHTDVPQPETPVPSETPRPAATTAAVLTALSPSSPITPTSTSAPFLPANLAVISPQNASKLKPVAALPEQGASVVAYSPDSRRVAAGMFRSNHVKIWDLASGQELFTLSGHVDPRIISYLAFSPDGSSLASGAQGWYTQNDSLILWDTGTGRELQRFNDVLGAISPDWRLAALTRRKQDQGATLILSDLTSGKVIHNLKAPGEIYGVSFSPQGERVAARMPNVYQDLFSFWLVDSGQHDRTQYDWVGFSFSPDGRYIAGLLENGSSDKGDLNIFDGNTFRWIKTLAKDADSFWYVYPAFSPDGQVLAASFSDHVILWETQDWKELASLPVSSHAGLAFSPDGRILTTYTYSGLVQLWGAHLR
jgi:WD40 repeat protein